jgi:hypothetical membrane protein
MRTIQKIYPFTVILALLSYIFCTLAAYLHFPTHFAPTTNWLSDLGNPDRNPQGAIFYNWGIILTGLLVLLFFLGVTRWKIRNLKIQNFMVTITQVFGILGSLALILSALFPINRPQHEFWSISLYMLLGTAFAFSVSALRYQPKCSQWVLLIGGTTAIVDILSSILHESTTLEWITVLMFVIYLFTLSLKNRELQG